MSGDIWIHGIYLNAVNIPLLDSCMVAINQYQTLEMTFLYKLIKLETGKSECICDCTVFQ